MGTDCRAVGFVALCLEAILERLREPGNSVDRDCYTDLRGLPFGDKETHGCDSQCIDFVVMSINGRQGAFQC